MNQNLRVKALQKDGKGRGGQPILGNSSYDPPFHIGRPLKISQHTQFLEAAYQLSVASLAHLRKKLDSEPPRLGIFFKVLSTKQIWRSNSRNKVKRCQKAVRVWTSEPAHLNL